MPPVVVAAGITAAGSIGGALIGSSSAKKAASKASDAQLQVARENNELAREFRQQNQANFQPWLNSGGRANALVDSFLFGPQPMPAPVQAGVTGGTTAGANTPSGIRARFLAMSGNVQPALQNGNVVQNAPLTAGVLPNGQPAPTGTVNATSAAPAGQNAMMNGYQAFVNSPFYQHPLQEGLQALNQGYAAGGMLQSGDAMKGITRFGQDYAAGRMGEFIGLAERQSDRGIQSASGIAGVGTNALASMSANNQNAANALSNAAIARGVATGNMWSGIGNAVGTFAGSLAGGGSSYSAPSSPMFTPNNPGVGF